MDKSEQENTNKPGDTSTARNLRPNSDASPGNLEKNAIDTPGTGSSQHDIQNQDRPETDNAAHVTDEIITQNSSPSFESEMEVHHHPQMEHKSKPFKEYLLEGFMIFIAVMMGFIAENIRENITDRDHVRHLTLQLVQDLKADTASLNRACNFETEILESDDTLIDLLQRPLEKVDTRRIQRLIANSHSMWPFHPSAGAIAAIKNELHLKQFSNSGIIGYIATYEGHIELLRTVQDITLQYQRAYLDPFLISHFTPAGLIASFSKNAVPEAQMRNVTQEDLTQLNAGMVLIRINTQELVDDNRLVRDDAVSLLRYVTKQYELKDE